VGSVPRELLDQKVTCARVRFVDVVLLVVAVAAVVLAAVAAWLALRGRDHTPVSFGYDLSN
jgi:hypothetical protein